MCLFGGRKQKLVGPLGIERMKLYIHGDNGDFFTHSHTLPGQPEK